MTRKTPLLTRLRLGAALMVAGLAPLSLLGSGLGSGWGSFFLAVCWVLVLGYAVGFVIGHYWSALLLTTLAYNWWAVWQVWMAYDPNWRDLLTWNLLGGSAAGAVVFWVMVVLAVSTAQGVKTRIAQLRGGRAG